MVVADDDIDTQLVGHLHLVVGLDAAVKGDEQADVVFAAILDTLVGYSVAFGIAVGNIIFDEILGLGADNLAKERV